MHTKHTRKTLIDKPMLATLIAFIALVILTPKGSADTFKSTPALKVTASNSH